MKDREEIAAGRDRELPTGELLLPGVLLVARPEPERLLPGADPALEGPLRHLPRLRSVVGWGPVRRGAPEAGDAGCWARREIRFASCLVRTTDTSDNCIAEIIDS